MVLLTTIIIVYSGEKCKGGEYSIEYIVSGIELRRRKKRRKKEQEKISIADNVYGMAGSV